MGYNTMVMVLNDGLGCIKNDVDFGKKLENAIARLSYGENNIDISSGYNANAATVVETHHADAVTVLACGGNCVTVLGSIHNGGRHHDKESQVALLKMLADKLGYRVSKKNKKAND